MKLSILLAVIVAVFTMSFTTASKSHVLGNTLAKADVTTGCFTSVVTGTTTYPSGSNIPPVVANQETQTINPEPGVVTDEGASAFSNPTTGCNATTYTRFCCIQVVNSDDGPIISKVFYRGDL